MDLARDYAIEPLSLRSADLETLSALVSQVFEEHGREQGGSIAFDADTFRFLFASPHADPELFVRATHRASGEVVGFLGGIPRRVGHAKGELRLGVPAWAAVHPAHQRHGLALAMGMCLFEIARGRGYDGGLAMFEPEAHGIDTARSVARRAGIAFHEICTIRTFLIRALDVERAASVAKLASYERLALRWLERAPAPRGGRTRLARTDDHPRLLELVSEQRERNDLWIEYAPEDFEWYLQQPRVACVVHEAEAGRVDGFVTAWEMKLAGFGRTQPFGWLDQVGTHRLRAGEARDVARALALEAKRRGWAGLQTPLIPYFDPWPFYRARFVPYPKRLVVALLLFRDEAWTSSMRRLHLDWR